MPTIYEIAKEAGVAPGTVSKVLNNYKQVNIKTKEKVMAVAKEMGYVPNITAQSLKTKQSYLVGIVFPENVGIGLDHPFFSSVLEYFRHKMGELGYDTIFINKTLGTNTMGYLEHCRYRNVDGAFIITAMEGDKDMQALLDSNIKCVTSDMVVEHIPYIMSNNDEGSRKVVEYLHKCGHRRIGHIAGPLHTMAAGERFKGFRDAIDDFGLEWEEKLLIESNWFNYESAYETTTRYIERFSKKDMPTAVFVSSDIMAMAAISAFNAGGYSVPEDISVIGFDDIEMASLFNPKLTTIRQDSRMIGETIAQTLYKEIQGEDIPEPLDRIPVNLIERETVRSLT